MQNMKKTIIAGVLAFSCSISMLPSVAGAAETDQVKLNINGQVLSFTEGEQAPEIVNARTYVPLRVISERLGAKVDWQGETRQVIITTQGAVPAAVENQSGDIQIIIDGKVLSIAADLGKPFISPLNRTMVPFRAVGEALNCDVDWEDASRTVVVKSKSQVSEPVPVTPEPSADLSANQLLTDLAGYRTNLKLMDGKVINSAELLNQNPAVFSADQLTIFKKYRDDLSKYTQTVTLPTGETIKSEELTILGPALLTAEQMNNYMAAEAPRIQAKMEGMGRTFNPFPDLAELYLKIGAEYGIRGDLAFFQAVKETGYFQFTGDVKPDQNNYCGLWATGSALTGNESLNGADSAYIRFEAGRHGATFVSPEAGVEAHIQHLYAYATKNSLPAGKVIVDPRFALVNRGIAPTWQNLNARWAVPGITYGQSIIF